MARGNQKIKSQEENKKKLAAQVCPFPNSKIMPDAGIAHADFARATLEIGKLQDGIRDATGEGECRGEDETEASCWLDFPQNPHFSTTDRLIMCSL
jgi:hypothetical protein